MSGRIRTVKPEWLEDELLAFASPCARVMSVALMLLADDYGNGRANPAWLRGQVFPGDPTVEVTRVALSELARLKFVSVYEVDEQTYFSIRNWAKHQRVDRPGKPRVPGPTEATRVEPRSAKVAYFIRGATTGLIKIGESIDPVTRLADLAKCGSETLHLLAIGGTEREHHDMFAAHRVHGEWFNPSEAILGKIRDLGGNIREPIAVAGYDGAFRKKTAEKTPFATSPGTFATSQEILAPDHDHDHDLDPDLDRDREPRARAAGPPRKPSNLETALALPLSERLALVLPDRPGTEYFEAHKWPEVIALARRFGEAMGCPTVIGPPSRDRGSQRLLEALEAFRPPELDLAVKGAHSDRWVRGKSYSVLTIDVLRRLMAEQPVEPTKPESTEDIVERRRQERMAREMGIIQ